MNKRQHKNEQKKIKAQVIERLERLESNSKKVLGDHKYMSADAFGIIMDRLKDEIKEM